MTKSGQKQFSVLTSAAYGAARFMLTVLVVLVLGRAVPVFAGFEWKKTPVVVPAPAAPKKEAVDVRWDETASSAPAIPAASSSPLPLAASPSAAIEWKENKIEWKDTGTGPLALVPALSSPPLSSSSPAPDFVPAPMPAPASLAPPSAQKEDIVEGFGDDLPLAIAVQQIVPAGYQFSFAPDVEPGSFVSWRGDRPWQQVLADTLAPRKLGFRLQDNVITISAALLPPPVKETVIPSDIVYGWPSPSLAVADLEKKRPSLSSRIIWNNTPPPSRIMWEEPTLQPPPPVRVTPSVAVTVFPPVSEVIWEEKPVAPPVTKPAPAAEPEVLWEEQVAQVTPPPVSKSAPAAAPEVLWEEQAPIPAPVSVAAGAPVSLLPDASSVAGTEPVVPPSETPSSSPPIAAEAPVSLLPGSSLPDEKASENKTAAILPSPQAVDVPPPPVAVPLPPAPPAEKAEEKEAEDKKELTVAEAAKAEPAPPAEETPWRAAKGRMLRDVLTEWAKTADVELYWLIDYDYRMADSVAYGGTFDEATGKLLKRFSKVRPQPYGRLHKGEEEGTRVLVISSYDIAY